MLSYFPVDEIISFLSSVTVLNCGNFIHKSRTFFCKSIHILILINLISHYLVAKSMNSLHKIRNKIITSICCMLKRLCVFHNSLADTKPLFILRYMLKHLIHQALEVLYGKHQSDRQLLIYLQTPVWQTFANRQLYTSLTDICS